MYDRNSGISLANRTKIDYDNTAEENIAINVSKARLIYKKFMKAPKGGAVSMWFGLFLTCFIAAVTGEFADVMNIRNSGIFIHFLFWVGTVGFAVVFLVSMIKYLLLRRKLGEESFISELKKKE